MSDMSDMNKLKSMDMLSTPISWRSDRFDIDDLEEANGHNESRIEAVCNGSDMFLDDSFDVVGQLVEKASIYRMEVAINSESRIGLWDNGRVVLDYDFDNQHWSMSAYFGDRPWTFCSPERVINTIVAGLECTALNQENLLNKNTVGRIIKSVIGDRQHIVGESVLYVNESGKKIDDCEYVPEHIQELYDFALPINE